MPLAVVSENGRTRLAKIFEGFAIDLSVAAPELPQDVVSFLKAGRPAIKRYDEVTAEDEGGMELSDLTLHAPVPKPEKFLAIGMNYREHAQEAAALGFETPSYQLWFNKQVSCVADPYANVVMPAVSDELDYEAEMAVVIGRSCRKVNIEEAKQVIGGYMVANDVSVRDWQRRSPTMTLGKSFDTHGPIGPWLTLAHEIDDPHVLRLRMLVNGEERQNDTTANMVHNIYEQIVYLSTVMTLEPGDILSTGTPSGVGAAQQPPRFLKIGDVMRVEIERLGHIENRVVKDS